MIRPAARVRGLLGALVVLIAVLSFGAGCGQGQALREQQEENEELRKQIAAQEAERKKAEEQQEAAERSQMQQENEELKQENEELKQERDSAEERIAEEQETEQQGSEPLETESGSPDVIIQSNEDWTASPSEAAEGVVVVSPDYDVQAVSTDEAYALDAAIAYYQEVEVGDYYTTHGLLSEEDQSLFPLDVWVQANTNLDSAAGEFVVTGAYPASVGNGYPTYAVTVAVYLPDGSSFDRTTYFTNEGNGYWAHWLSDEEMDLFNGAL